MELKKRHASKYTYTLPQMRLWACMISVEHHDSMDDPHRSQPLLGLPQRGSGVV